MKKITSFILTAVAVLGFSVAAYAMDLGSAKRSGLVGELPNGLIESTLPNPSATLAELITTTNAGRLEVYKKSADKQGIPLREVQSIAAKKLYELSSSGDYLMVNGKWIQK
jgi:hypothetical protein